MPVRVEPMMVTTSMELPGYRIVRNFGIVRGIIVRSRSLLGFVIGLLGLVQVGDGLIGVHYRSIPQAAIPFAFAIVQFACARWLLQSDGRAVSAHP